MTGPRVRTSFRHVAFQWRAIRYLTWRTSQLAGALYGFFVSGRRKAFWFLALLEAVLFAFLYFHRNPNAILAGDAAFAGYVVLAWLVLLFAFLLIHAWNRVVVEPFTDAP